MAWLADCEPAMSSFSKTDVEEIIAGLNLEQSNRVFAAHWLSLWEADALPPAAQFNPAKLKPFLAGLLKFDVVPDRRVTVKLAGTGYRYVLQKDPTGADWIAAAPESHRATRLKTFSTIARGAILVAHRRVAMLHGEDVISEEIFLPFAPDAEGAVTVLGRVNFTPEQFQRVKSIAQVMGDPLDHVLVPFSKTKT